MLSCNPATRVWLAWHSPIGNNFNEVVGGTIQEFFYVKSDEFEGVCVSIVWDKPVKDHFAYSKTLERVSDFGRTLFFSEDEAKKTFIVTFG